MIDLSADTVIDLRVRQTYPMETGQWSVHTRTGGQGSGQCIQGQGDRAVVSAYKDRGGEPLCGLKSCVP